MALPAYPEGLKYKPDLNSFRVLEPYRPPKWTEFEDGPPLGRRTTISRRSHLGYRIVFRTPAEFDRFKEFVEYDLASGTSRFTMPVYLPKTNSYATRSVMLNEGKYTADPFGVGFSVTFTLIVFNW